MADWMISNWMVWLIAVGAVVIFEIFTGTFYLLMIAVGLAAGAAAAFFGADMTIQLIVAAVIGALAVYVLRHSQYGSTNKIDPARNPDINLDIGQKINVIEWQSNDNGKNTARVMYRGAPWDVELEPGALSRPGTFTIHEIRGSRLIVTNAAD
jgi:membrane protein implicated in regulation of membrane protease activity